jgi:cytochrome P450
MTDRSELPPIAMFSTDPHRASAAYRPVSAAMYDDDQQGWLALRHRDISAMLREPSFKKDPALAVAGPYTQALLMGDWSMLFTDNEVHRRLRGLVSQAFSKRATEAARPWIQQIADQLLDGLSSTADPVELISAFAVPFPVDVIAEILGINKADRDEFKRWSDAVALTFDTTLDEVAAARVADSERELHDYLGAVIRARRVEPREDLISSLVEVRDANGSTLTDLEAVRAIAELLFGGNATTTDLIGNGILALLRNPDQLTALQADPSLITNAVEEILRYDTSVVMGDRIPMNNINLGGCPIKAGEWVWPVLSSANRDPEAHPDPDRFDIRRDPIHHVSFGGGPHYCLGASLARMETQIAIGSLVRRYPDLRLADPSAEPNYKNVYAFRGLSDLHVTLI